MPLCKEFEQKMIKYLWRTRSVSPRPFSTASTFSAIHQQLGITPSVTSIDEESQSEHDEKISADVQNPTTKAADADLKRHWWSWKLQPRSSTTTTDEKSSATTSSDPEKGGKRTERKLVMIGPIYAGCGAAMAACAYNSHSKKFFFLSSFPSSFSIILYTLNG